MSVPKSVFVLYDSKKALEGQLEILRRAVAIPITRENTTHLDCTRGEVEG